MKIKKLLFSAAAIILLISTLSGCSVFLEKEITKAEHIDIASISSVEEFNALITPFVDLSLYDATEEPEEQGIVYDLKEEYRKQKSYNFTHSLSFSDGTGFTLPVTIGELKKQGWNVVSEPTIYIENSQGNRLDLKFEPSSTEGNIDEYIVNGYDLKIKPTDTSQKDQYIIYEKLTEKSDFLEIIEHLGAPVTIIFDIDNMDNKKVVIVDLLYLDNDNYDNMTHFTISRDKELFESNYSLDHNYTSISVRDE